MSFFRSITGFFNTLYRRFVFSHDEADLFARFLRSFTAQTHVPSPLKQQMRQRLLQQIQTPVQHHTELYGVFRPIVRFLQQIALTVHPSFDFKKQTWANLRDLIAWQDFHAEHTPQGSFWGLPAQLSLRRHFAAAFFFVMLVGGSFSFLLEPSQVFASRLTYLTVTSGDVSVQRGDTLFTQVDRFYLDEGDVIKTGLEGYATIFYMDGSVSRLSPSTTVSLELLYLNPQDVTDTKVRVQVLRGRVWSHVPERTPETALFQIFSPFTEAVIQAAQQASFDVSVSDDGVTRVLAADNTVSVTVAQNTQTTLLAGDVMTVDASAAVDSFVSVDSALATADVDQWIALNQAEDKNYADSLALYYQKEAEFKAGVLPDSPLYGLKTLSEDAKLLLSFNQISAISTRLMLAENRLNEALVLSSKNKDVEALDAIADYSAMMHDVVASLAVLRDEESLDDYTQDDLDVLESSVSRLLGTQRRALMTLNSRTDIATVEQVTSDTQKLIAQLQEEHASTVTQASSVLFAAKDALDVGDTELALQYFAQYRNDGLSIGVDVSLIDPANRSVAVSDMITRKTEDVWFLTSLGHAATTESVENAVHETITAAIAQVNRILIGLVQSSDDLALSFAVVDVTAQDRDSQVELLDLLKSDATLPPVVVSRIENFLRALEGESQISTMSTVAPVVNTPSTAEVTVSAE